MKQKNSVQLFNTIIMWAFVGFSLWWLSIGIFYPDNHNADSNQWFAATYGLLALGGGIAGIITSRKWGAHKSLIGRALLFFSLGLLAQELGQIIYSFYLYALKIQIPYPSYGDIGYFASVLLYIYAAIQLLKATGAKFSLKDRSKKFIAVGLPLLLLIASYTYFLHGYHFYLSSPKALLTVGLDLGYPLGQALYVALALLTYLLSRELLGGIMKRKVLFVLLALLAQYVADFSFLYAAKAEKVYPAGANDYMYLVAYALMALALNSFRLQIGTPRASKTDTAK